VQELNKASTVMFQISLIPFLAISGRLSLKMWFWFFNNQGNLVRTQLYTLIWSILYKVEYYGKHVLI